MENKHIVGYCKKCGKKITDEEYTILDSRLFHKECLRDKYDNIVEEI